MRSMRRDPVNVSCVATEVLNLYYVFLYTFVCVGGCLRLFVLVAVGICMWLFSVPAYFLSSMCRSQKLCLHARLIQFHRSVVIAPTLLLLSPSISHIYCNRISWLLHRVPSAVLLRTCWRFIAIISNSTDSQVFIFFCPSANIFIDIILLIVFIYIVIFSAPVCLSLFVSLSLSLCHYSISWTPCVSVTICLNHHSYLHMLLLLLLSPVLDSLLCCCTV